LRLALARRKFLVAAGPPAAVFAALAVLHAVFSPFGEPFRNGDETRHVMTGVFVRDAITDITESAADPRGYASRYYVQYPALGIIIWPPVFYMVEGLAMWAFGTGYTVARAVVYGFALLGGVYAYLLVRRTHGQRVACATLAVLGLAPVVFEHTGYVLLEVPTLALVLASVLVVAAIAWWLLGERPHAGLLASIPLLLLGVTLVSGALGGETYGRDPGLGVLLGLATSVAYAGFLLVLRQGSQDLRRLAGPLLWASGSAAAGSAVLGLALGELTLPAWPALAWLAVLACTAQVVGWLLISSSLPRLPAAVTSVLLLAQPVAALAISTVVLSEAPTVVQYAGAGCILVGVAVATATRHRAPSPPTATPSAVMVGG